ncbi:MAG: amidohydrolase family protein [Armatimonadetes bacterium]|nr:amidohydrolase family protein [Armatimonadota bacterium]
MLDALIKNGRVIDGTGNPWYRANVGIAGDRIAYIGTQGLEARQIIDATDQVVAPGFWDVHTHNEFELLRTADIDGFIFQGITTIVTGNCSWGVHPDKRHKALEFTPSEAEEYRDLDWSGIEGYAALLNRKGATVNSIPLIGHGTIRWTVMGNEKRPPTPEELSRMQDLLHEGMRQGAVGMSTGLDYVPSCFADTDELVALGQTLRETGGMYVTHTRYVSQVYAYSYNAHEVMCPTEDRARHIEGHREALEVGRRAEIPVQISHLHTSGVIGTELAMIHQARREGVDVTVDSMAYNVPWCPRSDFLLRICQTRAPDYAHLPQEEFRRLLTTPEFRVRMSASPNFRRFFSPLTAGKWRLARTGNPELDGRSVAEIAAERKKTPVDVMFDVVVDVDHPALLVPPESVIQDLPREQITDDLIMMGSDAIDRHPGDPYLKATARGWAAIPRFLEHAQRFGQPLEHSVRRLASMPAARFGFPDRGTIALRQMADIIVFRQEQVKAKATLMDPYRPAEGMSHVLIGGQTVIENGTMTGRRPGRVLLRRV